MSKIWVAQPWRYKDAYDELHPSLKKRVVLIDDAKHAQTTQQILKPIFDDVGIVQERGGYHMEKNYDPSVMGTALELLTFSNYLSALDHGLMVHMDVTAFKRSLKILRPMMRSSDSQAHLDALSNVFATYTHAETGGIDFKSKDTGAIADQLKDFLADETYHRFSQRMHALGIPELALDAVDKSRSAAQAVLRKLPFKKLFDYTGTVVNVATKIPTPKADIFDGLFKKRYLPPMVNLSAQANAARKAWEVAAPSPIPPKMWRGFARDVPGLISKRK